MRAAWKVGPTVERTDGKTERKWAAMMVDQMADTRVDQMAESRVTKWVE